MTFASLPMILYVLPLAVLAAAFVPAQRKPDVLALGGLAAVWGTGGFPALILLLLSVSSTWLMLRLQPQKTATHHHRAELWLYAGIGIQGLLLLMGRVMLTDMQLIPLLICAMQGTECMSEYANNRFQVPALRPFFCYQCDMTRLPAGPVLDYASAEHARESRRVTVKEIGQGASWCIRGLFQLVCLGLPMYELQTAQSGSIRTAADAVFSAMTYYFSVYYGLKGTARIGQGIAKMLGLSYPESFDTPILAESAEDFRKRFLTPLAAWTERVLLAKECDAAGFFARMTLLLSGLGFLFGKGSSGVIWGVLAAAWLTAERFGRIRINLPLQARRVLTALLVLLGLGLMRSNSLIESFSFYSALLGISGIAPSDTAGYLMRTNWLVFLLCVIGLFPLHRLYSELPQKTPLRILRGICKAAAELFMLLAAYSTLLSSYLRS